MDFSTISKAKLLAALYNQAKSQVPSPVMTEEEAQELLDSGQLYFPTLHGKTLNIDLSRSIIFTDAYNTANGHYLAEKVIHSLLNEKPKESKKAKFYNFFNLF